MDTSRKGNAAVMSSCATARAFAFVPDHREVRVGTLAGVLKQAGIVPEDFAAWIKQ
jgi:hypothetical protein